MIFAFVLNLGPNNFFSLEFSGMLRPPASNSKRSKAEGKGHGERQNKQKNKRKAQEERRKSKAIPSIPTFVCCQVQTLNLPLLDHRVDVFRAPQLIRQWGFAPLSAII